MTREKSKTGKKSVPEDTISSSSSTAVTDELRPLLSFIHHKSSGDSSMMNNSGNLETSTKKGVEKKRRRGRGGERDRKKCAGHSSSGDGKGRNKSSTSTREVGGALYCFIEDLKHFHEQEVSIPQSLIIGICIAIVCGFTAYLYYQVMDGLLEYIWHTLPNKVVVGRWTPEWKHVLWMPIVTFPMALGVGLTVRYVGEPGDLAYTIECVHRKAYVELDHVLPMVLASQFSILGGGSLGPEAPLVAICAALAGFLSRNIFRRRKRNVIRKHTLMGMSGALAAFFGVPLGGSLFALEVCSKFGVVYFEHTIEAILVGVMTLGVFRFLARLPMNPLWVIDSTQLEDSTVGDLCVGGLIGLLAAFVGMIFIHCHFTLVSAFDKVGLLSNRMAVPRALVGSIVITLLGAFIPHTMFWGEMEIQQISTGAPARELPHVFPARGITGFEMGDSPLNACIVGVAKLIAISFTVASGYRGGFIFPLFTAGSAFGRAVSLALSSSKNPIASSLPCLCFAAGLNVAITKTSMATPLILCFLAGEQFALPAVLTASLVSIFATSYTPFIKTQISRQDIHRISDRQQLRAVVEDDEASFLSSIGRSTKMKRTTILIDAPEEENEDMELLRSTSFIRTSSLASGSSSASAVAGTRTVTGAMRSGSGTTRESFCLRRSIRRSLVSTTAATATSGTVDSGGDGAAAAAAATHPTTIPHRAISVESAVSTDTALAAMDAAGGGGGVAVTAGNTNSEEGEASFLMASNLDGVASATAAGISGSPRPVRRRLVHEPSLRQLSRRSFLV